MTRASAAFALKSKTNVLLTALFNAIVLKKNIATDLDHD